jgi:hypothetical protein
MKENYKVGEEEPVEAHLARELNALGHVTKEWIEESFGKDKIGFVILMFQFGEGGRMNYLSNARREDIIKALEELLENFKASQKT